MHKLSQWLLLVIALVAASGISGAWTSQGQKAQKIQGAGKQMRQQEKKKIQQAIKVMPTIKTSLVEAVTLAEKETTGKAFEAALDPLNPDHPVYLVRLVVGEKGAVAIVDPETKKVTLREEKKEADEAGHDDHGDEGEEEGG